MLRIARFVAEGRRRCAFTITVPKTFGARPVTALMDVEYVQFSLLNGVQMEALESVIGTSKRCGRQRQ
jgi:hypothetical protein